MIIRNEKGWACVEYTRWREGDQLYETFTFRDPDNPAFNEVECFKLTPHLPSVRVCINLEEVEDDRQLPLPVPEEK